MARLELYHFAFSHYNEKVRWTLDLKGLESRRRALLPGFHERTVRRHSGGPTTTPLLRDGDRAISGSTDIVLHLDRVAPDPPLLPEDPAERDEALRWVAWADEEIGPPVRLALFHELMADPAYMGRMFTTGQTSRLVAAGYRRMFPRVVPMLRGRMGIDADSAKAAGAQVEAALARVEEATGKTGYLVGARFTLADLTTAALLFPLVFPDEIPFELPTPQPELFTRWVARWDAHPGAGWVRAIWSRHRRPRG